MENFVANTMTALFIVGVIAFVCNIVATNPKRKHMNVETWDNGRVRYVNKPQREES